METFSARPYREGDADAINALYQAVTGIARTPEQFAWQWLKAPAGPGEIWVIEAAAENGETRIIGHHGLMPLAFSHAKQDLLAGKTENTMVHPDYRRKILYPRYEKRFLNEYSDRFDLLFSTIGPMAALRQRKALGYDASRRWQRYEWALRPGAMAALGAGLAGNTQQFSQSSILQLAEPGLRLAAKGASVLPRKQLGDASALTALDAATAKAHPFFEAFWAEARAEYPLTPRRDRADLAWRFWDNPDLTTTTLICDESAGMPRGYAVVHRYHKLAWRLDDIVCQPADVPSFLTLLQAVAAWCAEQGGYVLNFFAADDPNSPARFGEECGLKNLSTRWPMAKLRGKTPNFMLRKVTERGAEKGGQTGDWYANLFLFEARH